MKLNGFVGKGSGKLGASVFAISGGEQIVRQYNPQVSNPNTEAQVAQRAKLKLMSQLASALANAIAMKKVGLVSARNQFVSKNIGLATYEDGEALVNLLRLSITSGTANFPQVQATKGTGSVVNIQLASAAPSNVGAVVYAIYNKTGNAKLEEISIKVVETAGAGSLFPTTENVAAGEIVVYAYGVKTSSLNKRTGYGNYETIVGEENASLTVNQLSSIDAANLTINTATSLELD